MGPANPYTALTFGARPASLAGIPGQEDRMPLARPSATLLLGGFIGLAATCGGLDLDARPRALAAGTPPSDGQPDPASAPDFAAQRARMVRLIRLEAELTRRVTGVGAIGPRVLAAMAEVPRHRFVPEPLAPYAYLPRPLPVHPEQNLAAPFLVALMTDLAQVEPHHRVLETGTGEGYHAAVLDRLAAEVHSVEVIPELARAAGGRLAALGYGKVRVHEGDGYDGWPAAAPFDAIIVKEAVDHVPAPLLAQLRPGGRLVLPLGPPDGPQQLTVVRRGAAAGAAREERGLPVRFTPLQGGERI
jgi:protein-L-isoaspartate(D-aspartate) O-methyltransferase